jgi:chloramphenicol 3-O-phosphotransferase
MNKMTTKRGQIVFFTGPAAAGKSTVAEAWATSRTKQTAHFDHDHARFLVRAGYISPAASLANPALHEAAVDQWLLAAAVCEAMAVTYTTRGVDFALSAFCPPGNWKESWEPLDALNPMIVVLLPKLEVVLRRDANRVGRSHVGEQGVRRNFAYDWETWRTDKRAYVIDNSELSVEQTVALVEAAVIRHSELGAG